MWEKIINFFSQFGEQKTLNWWEEQYLNSAQNHADLENRQRELYIRNQRNNNYWSN
jgi:hypothetical protein